MKLRRKIPIQVSAIIIGLLSLNTVSVVNAQGVENELIQVQSSSQTEIINISDKALKECINKALGKSDLTSDITKSEMESITKLTALVEGVSGKVMSLDGLEYATNLESLYLDFQKLNDISALGKMKGLKALSLGNSVDGRVVDLSIISELTDLTYLDLSKNNIPDLSFTNNLTNLESLDLHGNQASMTDISQIKSLKKLKKLVLSGADGYKLKNLEYISELTDLKKLSIYSCEIEDISMLENLINIEELTLSCKKIIDISALSKMENLKYLRLDNNQIVDISSLSNMKKLERVYLEKNKILDLSPLKDLNNLSDSYVREQRCVLNEQIVKNGKLIIKNPLVHMDGNKVLRVKNGTYQDIIVRAEGDYLIVENLTYDKLVSLGFKLNVRYDERTWDLEYGGTTYSTLEIPIRNTFITFSDIEGNWAKDEINKFVENGYLSGYEDKTFKPDNSITRAEFVKIVNKVYGFTSKGTEEFKDVEKGQWFYDDICIAVKEGYIEGKSKDIFAPSDEITRQEVAMILTNIGKNKDTNLDKLGKFKDGNKVVDWAKSSVEGAIEVGYLRGYEDNTIGPTNPITRSEAVATLSRVK